MASVTGSRGVDALARADPILEMVEKMTKEELVRKLAAYDAEAEARKSQIRQLQARLKELELDRRRHLEQLERGDYGVA